MDCFDSEKGFAGITGCLWSGSYAVFIHDGSGKRDDGGGKRDDDRTEVGIGADAAEVLVLVDVTGAEVVRFAKLRGNAEKSEVTAGEEDVDVVTLPVDVVTGAETLLVGRFVARLRLRRELDAAGENAEGDSETDVAATLTSVVDTGTPTPPGTKET